MEKLLRDLVEKNYTCITELFFFGNLPYGEVISLDGVYVAKTSSDKYKTLDDIKKFLSQTYVDDETSRLLGRYFAGKPLYFERDGELYVYAEQTTGAGLPSPWEEFNIKIENSTNTTCRFDVYVKYAVTPSGDFCNRYVFEAVNNGTWRLKNAVTKPSDNIRPADMFM